MSPIDELFGPLKIFYDSHNDADQRCLCGFCDGYRRGFGDMQIRLNLSKIDKRINRPSIMDRLMR